MTTQKDNYVSPWGRALIATVAIWLAVTLSNHQARVVATKIQNDRVLNYLVEKHTVYTAPANVNDALMFLNNIGSTSALANLVSTLQYYRGYKDWYLQVETVSYLGCTTDPTKTIVDVQVQLIRNGEQIEQISTNESVWIYSGTESEGYLTALSQDDFSVNFTLRKGRHCVWNTAVSAVYVPPVYLP